jgi:hypothetical protein
MKIVGKEVSFECFSADKGAKLAPVETLALGTFEG